VDLSFDPGSGVNRDVFAIAVQPDGKVLLGGAFSAVNGAIRTRIARLNPDGSPDSSFNPGAGVGDAVFSLAAQPDGKVLIGGRFVTVRELTRPGIAPAPCGWQPGQHLRCRRDGRPAI
jgi:hypothetical protein